MHLNALKGVLNAIKMHLNAIYICDISRSYTSASTVKWNEVFTIQVEGSCDSEDAPTDDI